MKNFTIALLFLLAIPAWSFQIFVKPYEGGTITLDVEPDELISSVKEKLVERLNLPVPMQRLIYGGKQLEDDKTITEYNIVKESTVHVLIRVFFN